MSIIDDFANRIDGYGLIAPYEPAPKSKSSGNGVMYFSEYIIILKNSPEFVPADSVYFMLSIMSCISPNGMLNRVPIHAPVDDLEQADDYYAVLNACKQLEVTALPRLFLGALIKNLGFMNNVNPAQKTLESFLLRFPQLICAMISAAYPSFRSPKHILIRILAFPLYLYSALVIAISCYKTSARDADPRRLAWHLIHTVRPVSLLCYLASLIWYRRLYNDYGDLGMKAVAAIYYQPQGTNPFAKYWPT